MLALRAKIEAEWVLAHASVLSEFLFFRYLGKARSLTFSRMESGMISQFLHSIGDSRVFTKYHTTSRR
uniref:Uncharacterized protein n=1 Tax=Candidatus Kentrum sp. LFY TaxID=2126342 RepID=A0A450UIS9_9GAMM|nr:MAG: hypothetical protein BECKLFY1418B_GA0070995_10357 [Candidatus Kentron sp. LFY]